MLPGWEEAELWQPHVLDLSRAEDCTAAQERQSLSEITDVPQEDNQNSLFSVFNVAVWQVLVMLCHTDLSGVSGLYFPG